MARNRARGAPSARVTRSRESATGRGSHSERDRVRWSARSSCEQLPVLDPDVEGYRRPCWQVARIGGGDHGLPSGTQASRASDRAGSSSEKTSSRRRIGALPTLAGDQLMAGQPQGQRQGALLPLRGVGPSAQSANFQEQLVPMGTHGRHPPPQVVAARPTESRVQIALPAPLVGQAGGGPVPVRHRFGQASVGGR